MVEIKQEDREAAANYALDNSMIYSANYPAIIAGSETWDNWHLTQAFARHRLEATQAKDEEIARLREAFGGLLALCEATTFSDQYPAECEQARQALGGSIAQPRIDTTLSDTPSGESESSTRHEGSGTGSAI